MITIPEMANELDVCPETVRKYIKQFKFKGIYKNIGKNQNVLLFSQKEYDMIRDTVEASKTKIQDYYTTKEIAELAGCSTATVNAASNEFQIYKIVKPTNNSRKAYYPKESADKIIDIIQCRRDRRYKDAKKAAQQTTEETTPEELHPLVTNKEFLKLNVWPDVVPECFKEII